MSRDDRRGRAWQGRLLRQRSFRGLFLAHTLSQTGFRVVQISLPLTAVTVLRADVFQVGLLAMCQTFGFLLVGLPAGAWVDRMPKLPVLVRADLCRAGVLATVPPAAWAGLLTLAQLCAVALAVGVLSVFFDVAAQSYVPSVLPAGQLVAGNAALQGVESAAAVLGPLTGGLLGAAVSPPLAVTAGCAGYLWSAGCLLRVGPEGAKDQDRTEATPGAARRVTPGPRGATGAQVAEGLRFLAREPRLRRIAVATGVFNLFWAMVTALLVVFLVDDIGVSEGTAGAVLAATGAGGVCAAFLVRRVTARMDSGRAIVLGLALCAPPALLVPLAARGPGLWAAAAGLFGVGFGAILYNVSQISLRQTVTPPAMLGRVNASMRFLVWGALPLGGFAGGALAGAAGTRTAIWTGAIGASLAWLTLCGLPGVIRDMTPATDESGTKSATGRRQRSVATGEDDHG